MIKLQKSVGGSWVDVDLESEGIADFKLNIGYSHPSRLSFVAHTDHQTLPIDPFVAVRFWEDGETDSDGNPFSSSNPAFLGFVEEANPGEDGHEVEYTCLDSTARAANQIPIMSAAWQDADNEALGAVPRLVFNSTIDNDDDYAFSRDFNLTVGEIIAVLLDDAQPRLEALLAAPSGGGDAYVSADLAGMDFEPQEKIVFMSEAIRAGILRMMNDWEPEYRMIFNPGSRKWRFADIRAGSTITLTLNDFTVSHPVLQFRLQRSLEGRASAVKIYGPEALENRTVTLSGGGLEDVSDGPLLETFAAGTRVEGKNKWRITDADRRRIGRILPTPINVPSPEFRWAPNAWTQYSTWSRGPSFQARWKDNNAGTDVWVAVAGWWYDQDTGIIDFKDRYVYRYNLNPEIEDSILQPHHELPEDVRFIYPSYIEPLSVRIPSSGNEGDANSDYGLVNEHKIYDEMLAVGFLYGTAVTSATRISKFQILARKILDTLKDVIHTGGVTLEGIDYRFHMLDRLVNVDGIDADGNAKTTGWESLGAIVTDVEYDYEEETTTIQFSTDQAELAGFDAAETKEQLKIGASFIRTFVNTATIYSTRRAFTEWGTPIIGQDVSVVSESGAVVIDPFFGTIDAPLNSG